MASIIKPTYKYNYRYMCKLFFSLTALKHIYQIAKHGDCVTKFQDSVKRKEPVIISAVIL